MTDLLPPPKRLKASEELSPAQQDKVHQMLPAIEKLRGYSNFGQWLDDVHRALETWQLEDYIDPSAPRPAPDDDDYIYWVQQANVIFSWLHLHTSPTICEDPIFVSRQPRLPEDFINTVRDVVSRVSLETATNLWWSTIRMDPFDYRSPDGFFAAFRDLAEQAILVGVITPYQAFFVLHQHLPNLENVFTLPYAKYSDTLHCFGMAGECPKTMTEETFNLFCEHIEELPQSAYWTWKRVVMTLFQNQGFVQIA
ncbi:uncharacterized protein BO72DRAFT_482883 [Aspergillus fijiensis CBS 313.89]|uniref:Uncharacterized protein n=1 Tax=Aspergillus fijiensis CBS 313.89 TaxID=1448319 RepID=A0A8G1RZL8_9EURO|nr:uncharacterized protein BO72DRAFT_482883 [Aspergillus fijiensis CBS 313.89]RAK81687.1 hypothetical protein BO72DRAFT_482883 [Aspergillus fijiensis CBS 313.89]